MSLFPAYASDPAVNPEDENKLSDSEDSSGQGVSPALESQLLASDEEPPAGKRARPSSPAQSPDFYLDTKIDCGNLRVSTLYYPGRPEYRRSERRALGEAPRPRAGGARARRYWQRPAGAPPAPAAQLAAREARYRDALAAAPHDERLWLQYVHFQEEFGSERAALAAASEGARAVSRSPRLRAALLRARRRALPPAALRDALREDLRHEKRSSVRLELWTHLLESLGAEGAVPAASAALAHLAADPAAYPHVLYVHGCVLRAAGLWERLVTLVELTAAMNFPPSRAFPPEPAGAEAERRREEALAAAERAACASGMPAGAVWARVERLRAAAHWRPAAGAALAADPQRAGDAPAAAELVRAARGAAGGGRLVATLLRLARVPLLPAGEAAAAAAGPEPRAGEAALADALAALVRAARRLAPAHAARPPSPAAARALLAPLLDPPHCYSDADGYLSWTRALWEACCEWTSGWRRLAVVCWRLRWLHALCLLTGGGEEEEEEGGRRLRGEARALVRRWAREEPVVYAHLARIEAIVCGADAGRRAAARAVHAAVRARSPREHALYCARVHAELAGPGEGHGQGEAGALLAAAALGQEPPPRGERAPHAPHALLQAALRECEERCDALEREFSARGEEEEEEEREELLRYMLPGAGEWGAARVALRPPGARAPLAAALLARAPLARAPASLQYYEQTACALLCAAHGPERARLARDLCPHFPGNALLALECGGAARWRCGAAAAEGERATLAALVPRLLAAAPAELARWSARAGARPGRGGGVLAAARLEAEARASGQRVRAALYAALAELPDHKWLYVRGAARAAEDAGTLSDALLERGLRLHALPDELPRSAL